MQGYKPGRDPAAFDRGKCLARRGLAYRARECSVPQPADGFAGTQCPGTDPAADPDLQRYYGAGAGGKTDVPAGTFRQTHWPAESNGPGNPPGTSHRAGPAPASSLRPDVPGSGQVQTGKRYHGPPGRRRAATE